MKGPMKPSRSPAPQFAFSLTIRRSPVAWAHAGDRFRPYQAQVARAVKPLDYPSPRSHDCCHPSASSLARTELQAHIFAWLLFRYSQAGGIIVSVSPTFDPQVQIQAALPRSKSSQHACLGSRGLWISSRGPHLRVRQCPTCSSCPPNRMPTSWAPLPPFCFQWMKPSLIPIPKFDRDFDPMTASTNATRVIWGTAGDSHTLLNASAASPCGPSR